MIKVMKGIISLMYSHQMLDRTVFNGLNQRRNIGSGIPAFAPLIKLQPANTPYIRDDTMFIKVMIDFLGMPPEIFPYAFGLSPALTTEIQQAMIQQEIEERGQQQPSLSTTTNNEINNLIVY